MAFRFGEDRQACRAVLAATPADKAKARAQVVEAETRYDSGDSQAALERYEDAYLPINVPSLLFIQRLPKNAAPGTPPQDISARPKASRGANLGRTVSRFFEIVHLGDMNSVRVFVIVPILVLGPLACSNKDSLLYGQGGGPARAGGTGAGGSGAGGTTAKAGTGGSGTGGMLSGTGGAPTTGPTTVVAAGGTATHATGGTTTIATGGTTTVATGGATTFATGGNAGVGGRGGASGGGGSVVGGAGGSTVADAGRDAPSADAVDAPVACGPGYPVGSSQPTSDGCNTCTCEANGLFVCTTNPCPGQDASTGIVCPALYRWCPGCTPGTGTCSAYCPAAPCFIGDGGAAEVTADATVACSGLTTQADCEARSDCHPVFQSLGACGCAAAGCCMRFNRCASGAKALCTAPPTFGCTVVTPSCDTPFVISYSGSCYEGCVQTSECGS